jgi:hypothetical protein
MALASSLALLGTACGSEVESGSGTGGAGGGAGGSGATTGSTLDSSTGTGATGPGSGTTTSGSASTGAGTDPAFAACSTQGSCVLAANTCCGVCGMPTLDDVDPVNTAELDAHRAAVCPDPTGPCPACASEPNPNLFAYCDLGAGSCAEGDLSRSPFAECSGPDDCTLRLSLECCECGASGEWVAVAAAKQQELEGLLCAPDVACAKCEPVPPADVTAACVQGYCAVVPVN